MSSTKSTLTYATPPKVYPTERNATGSAGNKSAEVSQRISQQPICGDSMARMDQDEFPATAGASHLPSLSAVPIFWG